MLSKTLTLNKKSKLFSILMALYANSGIAGTLYVDVSGDDNAPGTSSEPFRSIQQAVKNIKPGDTIIVRDGEYLDTDNNDWVLRIHQAGTASKWITIKSENRYGAKLIGHNTTGYGVAFLPSSQYIRFEGFEVTGMRMAGLWGYKAKNIKISNNHIHHNTNVLIKDCSDGHGRVGIFTNMFTENFVINGNLIHDNGRIPTPACDKLPLALNHNYRHDHAMYLQGKYHLVYNNVIHSHPAGYSVKIDGHFGAAEITKYPYTHVIINNTFGRLTRKDSEAGGVIRIFNNRTVVDGFGSTLNPKPLIQNNIFYNPGGPGSDTAIRITRGSNSSVSGTIVKGNATTSKYIYSENLGPDITKNVSASNNLTSTELPLQSPELHDYNYIKNCPTVEYFHHLKLEFDIKTYDAHYVSEEFIGAINNNE